jgi:outer membrane protein OmpA-like peptidoglycan-associated protein
MRRTIAAFAGALLLAGCTTYSEADRETWHVSHHGDEIDYEGMDEVLFATDSAELSHRAYDAVAAIADDVRHHPHWLIEVNGYTDTVGTHDYNVSLSRARAQSAADALIHNGIEPGRIIVHGFGETHLAVPTGNDVAEGRNRRVVIRLIPPGRS